MRQKYLMSKEGTANDLVIREYAVIGKDPSQTQGSLLIEDDYVFVGQENYKSEAIKISIPKGINDLVMTLRTDNLFPNGPMAAKIAESVIALYSSFEDRSSELFFDDIELLVHS